MRLSGGHLGAVFGTTEALLGVRGGVWELLGNLGPLWAFWGYLGNPWGHIGLSEARESENGQIYQIPKQNRCYLSLETILMALSGALWRRRWSLLGHWWRIGG